MGCEEDISRMDEFEARESSKYPTPDSRLGSLWSPVANAVET